jgi:hypothetical protein
VASGVALVALEMSWYLPALAGDDVIAYRGGGFLVGGGAMLAGAWLALRDRTTGAAELVAVTPTAPWRPWRARLVGVAAAAAGVFAVGFVAALAVSAARGGRGTPDLRLLADGVLAVVLSGWVGVAVGRLSGSRMVSVLAAPVWVALSTLVAGQGQTRAPSLSVQNLAPVLNLPNRSAAYGFLPDPLWPHLGYLLGLTVLVGALLVALVSQGRPQVALWPVLVVAAAGLVLSGTAAARLLALPDAVLVLGPDRGTWKPVEGDLGAAAEAVAHDPGRSFPPTATRGPAPGTRPCRPACTRPTASGWPGPSARPSPRWPRRSPACPVSPPGSGWCPWDRAAAATRRSRWASHGCGSRPR